MSRESEEGHNLHTLHTLLQPPAGVLTDCVCVCVWCVCGVWCGVLLCVVCVWLLRRFTAEPY